jgi:hypothetical protein
MAMTERDFEVWVRLRGIGGQIASRASARKGRTDVAPSAGA